MRNWPQNRLKWQELPLWDNMSRCNYWVSFDLVISMAQIIGLKKNKKCQNSAQNTKTCNIFNNEVRKKRNPIRHSFNTQRVIGTFRMQQWNMSNCQTYNDKRQNLVKAKKTVECSIIDWKPTPNPFNKRRSDERNCWKEVSNYRSAPETYLTPGQNITNKTSSYYSQ